MKRWKVFLFLMILMGSFFANAQNESVVLNLSATEFNGKVLLSWSITQGNTCNGITVLRANDTTGFNPIGNIEGICGSTAETIDYQFTDTDPLPNAVNHYRLSMGGLGFSYIVDIEVVDAGDQKYIIVPNPVSNESKLIFNNDNQEEVTITFFNEKGEVLYEETSSEQSISLQRDQFKQGLYFFVLKSKGGIESFSGKISVL